MTARTAVPGLGPLESAIMTVLWNASRPLKPQEVRDQIDYHEVGYTTVASVLTILRDKEMTRRARQGRAYLYEAAVSRDQHLGRIVRAALDAADDPGLRPRPRLVHRLRSQSWLGRGLSPGVGSWNGREYLCGPASGSADPGFLRRASGLARSGRMSLAVGSGTLLDDLSVHNWAEESPAARITGCADHRLRGSPSRHSICRSPCMGSLGQLASGVTGTQHAHSGECSFLRGPRRVRRLHTGLHTGLITGLHRQHTRPHARKRTWPCARSHTRPHAGHRLA